MNPTVIFWKPELRIDVLASGLVVAVKAVKPNELAGAKPSRAASAARTHGLS